MIRFFTTHKKIRGAITVFLTLIYLSVYLLIGIFVDGGRVRMAGTVIEDAQQIATENVMAEYNRGLYEYYGLFGVSDYNVEKITKDVQAQIEETVGLKVPDDTVKEFILDVATGVDSFSKNYNILTKGDNKVVAATELFKKIGDDIDDSHKQFDPYGIEIAKVDASYIDLTNIDAMRAQMRDEMRYTAPLVLGANFLSCLSELISMGDAADAVSKSADIIKESEGSGEKELKEYVYLESLNGFSDKFHEFVIDSYGLETDLEAIKWGIQAKGASVKRSIDNATRLSTEIQNKAQANFAADHPILGALFGSVKSFAERAYDIINPGPKLVSLLYNEVDYYITRTDQTGLKDLIKNNKGKLTRFYDDIDGFDRGSWPDGDDYLEEVVVGHDEDGPVYELRYTSNSRHRHSADIDQKVDERRNEYKSEIGKLINSCDTCIFAIENAINEVSSYMNHIDLVEERFITEINANSNISNKAKNIFEQNMGIYLRQWENLDKQKIVLDNIKGDLIDIKEILNNSLNDVEEVSFNIKNETVNQAWNVPRHKLTNKRKDDKDKFQEIMENLADNDDKLAEFQRVAEGDAQAKNIISLINSALSYKEGVGSSLLGENQFVGIHKHKESTNIVRNPYDVLAETGEGEQLSVTSEFTIFNVVEKVKEIMDIAKNFAKKLPEAVFNNLYDEAYILSHCRDYVHTYRYSELGYSNKSESEIKEIENSKGIDIDTVLNPKFVNDLSDTNYLSNDRLKELQVTPAEIEYIIFGLDSKDGTEGSSYANVVAMYTSIFIIRLALNYIAAISSPISNVQITELSASTLIFAPLVYFAAPLIYAIPQSIVETKQIMYDCEKVNLWNASATLDLYEGFANLANETIDTLDAAVQNEMKELKNTADEIESKAESSSESKIPIEDIAESVLRNEDSNDYPHVRDSAWRLTYSTSSSDGSRASSVATTSTVGASGSGTGVILDAGDKLTIKAGYSDYLLIGLFLLGIGKKRQISNLQDVIEGNMAKGQAGFELRNTYSQISVETECSIKYIFMTQSFMGNTFSSTRGYKRHGFKIKTAFAY